MIADMKEDFSLDTNKESGPALTMTVSPVFGSGDDRYAFVSFTDGERTAEGKIPDCVITNNKGFSDEEKKALSNYMKRELSSLKKLASSQGPLQAMMKKGPGN